MQSQSLHSSQSWLAPLSPIKWQCGSATGELIALSEKSLRIKGLNQPQTNANALELSIEWELQHFLLLGTLSPEASGPDQVYTVASSHQSKLHELLNLLRKSQHLRICQEQDVEASDRFTGFSRFSFIPEAMPDLDWDDISLQQTFLGHTFSAPLLITGMTGGIAKGQELNYRLAKAAETWGIPMGIGSQRLALENPEHRKIFTVKDHAPNLFLIANLGGSQLLGSDAVQLARDAVTMVAADALAIHLNVIQECVQVEGSPRFRGLLGNVARICEQVSVPVIIKEVGSGISPATAQRLIKAGVSAIDCGGKGGTSWGYIEGLRSSSNETLALAHTFRDWGIPTAYSLRAIRQQLPNIDLIATGGIRDGLTVAKALGLGATMVGLGLPLLRAASESEQKLHEVLGTIVKGLQTTMLATDCAQLCDLRSKLICGQAFEKDPS